ncbi:MAG: trigger factor [Bacteroidota bacterium]
MDVTINPISSVRQEAAIEVPASELRPLFDEAYEAYRRKLELPGFRKGKAPLELVKKRFGEAIEQESIERAADEFYRKAMEERSISPVGTPAVVEMDFRRGERLRFTIKYEVKPEIVLGEYRRLRVEKPVYVITDRDVQAEVEHLRRANSTRTEVRAVTDPEHLVTADLQELDETGTPLIGRKSSGMRFLLSDPTLAPGLRDALLGAETGRTVESEIEMGEGEQTRKGRFAVAVTKIEKVHLPEVDDAFVKKITQEKLASTADFLADVRRDLERYGSEQSERKLRDAIADEVVRLHPCEVPDSMVDGFLDGFVEELKSRSRDRQLPRNFDEGNFRRESRPLAVWQSRWLLLREAIAAREHIGVTDEDLDRLAEAEAERTGIGKDRIREYYKRSPGVAERLLSDKILAFLRQQAEIREVEVPAAR